MRTFLRSLAYPIACAFTGAATGLLVHTLSAAPTPVCAGPSVIEVHTPPPPPPPAPPLPPRHEPPPRAEASFEIPDDAIRCTSETRCVITRAFLDDLFSNPARLERQARVMPSIRDGVPLGFKFYGIRPDSLPKRLGMRNGDLVNGINGAPVHTFEQVMRAVQSLRTATVIDLDIERKGQPLRLHIDLE